MRMTHICAVALLAAGCMTANAATLPTTTGWFPMPNTQLETVCAATHGFPQVWGNSGCPAITFAWSGGVFDTTRNRLIIFGGGHTDYLGNELYAVDLNTQSISRITDPGLPLASGCVPSLANGTQPNSRHTYDGIEYIAAADKMFVFGGSLACGAGNFGNDTWTFDFKTMKWTFMNPSGPAPVAGPGDLTAYDPGTGLIYLHDLHNLFSYDVNTNKYTQLTTGNATLGYHMEATFDPKRKKFVIIGYDSVYGAGRVYVYDVSSGSSYKMQQLNTTGDTSVVSQPYPGLDYDPVSDRIVAWAGNTPNTVYSLNLDTGVWTSQTFQGGPAPVANGTFGRFRYSAASGVFVLANAVTDDVYVVRIDAGSGTGTPPTVAVPNPPTNVTVQ